MQKLNQGSIPKKGCNFFRGSFFAARPVERSDFGSTFLLLQKSKIKVLPIFLSFQLLLATSIAQNIKSGALEIHFIHTANGKEISLRDSTYTNPFGETYTVSKLRFYIGQLSVPGSGYKFGEDDYYLVNAANEMPIEINLKPGSYNSLQFLLGVDSLHNCSGAQTGALDPTNDMFWTWNSGYVMYKLEGTSPASTADLNRIEHHVGGYKGENNVATPIKLTTTQPFRILENKTTVLVIENNLDHYWKGQNDIKISDGALIMTPGPLSKKIAANFSNLFTIKSISVNP